MRVRVRVRVGDERVLSSTVCYACACEVTTVRCVRRGMPPRERARAHLIEASASAPRAEPRMRHTRTVSSTRLCISNVKMDTYM